MKKYKTPVKSWFISVFVYFFAMAKEPPYRVHIKKTIERLFKDKKGKITTLDAAAGEEMVSICRPPVGSKRWQQKPYKTKGLAC